MIGVKKRNVLKTSHNENTIYQISLNSGNTVLIGKFVPINPYVKKLVRSEINNLT